MFLLTRRISSIAAALILTGLFVGIATPLEAGIGLQLQPSKSKIAPLAQPQSTQLPSFSKPFTLWPVFYPPTVQYLVTLDSTLSYVTLTQQLRTYNLQIPYRLPFPSYLTFRSRLEIQNQWKESVYWNLTSGREVTKRSKGLMIETPKIKSRAFQKIFGGDNLSLRVNGNINIDGGMRNEKKSYVQTAQNQGSNTNFEMKQTQQFKVEGKIGENVSVNVDQDSERAFDFENAIKLEYNSDEDGVVQSIEAGNVTLSLPATRFVTFSSQNSGLFGIKANLKVGKLDITTIASMEKGQKKKLTVEGGAENNTYELYDYDYKRYTYFFLDDFYRSQYRDGYEDGIHKYNEKKRVEEIELYKSDAAYENKQGSLLGWAVLDPAEADTSVNDGKFRYRNYFVRVEQTDYYYDPELGYIAMNNQLSQSEVLAVAFLDADGNQTGTMLAHQTDSTEVPVFKIIKPKNPNENDATWNLEWKNVYSLGSRNIEEEGFDLKIYNRPASGEAQESTTAKDGTEKGYLNIFGLDNLDENGSANPDNVVDLDNSIINLSRGEVIFPDLRPFDPESETLLPDDQRVPAIYDTSNTAYIRLQSGFTIKVTSSSRSPNYSLGINVIEGSEEVTLNGSTLVKDTDYIIDYFSGSLTLLNEEATNPNAKLEINYESQQLFSVDKKTLLGTRAEYTLWEDGNNRSFIGGTFLYLNQKTLEQRVRVGKGPMRNMVWDINTSLKFQPDFLTKALDALPLLSAQSPSTISFEGEIAQVIPNPNTLNNDKTGDPSGVAYLDDFESAKRQVTLGVMRSAWLPCSTPGSITEVDEWMKKRGHLVWYNPYEQVAITDIWPDREVSLNYGGTTRTHVLNVYLAPDPDAADPSQYWGGVQRALSSGYSNLTDYRFLEVWVWGKEGKVHIDLGQISEDVIPNQKLNTEDKYVANFRNDILDDDEDTGVDGVFGDDPPELFYPHEYATIDKETNKATPYDFWDLNGDYIKQEDEPWSYDDWSYQSASRVYNYIDGTENNRNSEAYIDPDSEDLNNNSAVDLNNDYFEFSFNLDLNNPDTSLVVGGDEYMNDKGWRLFRIPLSYPDKQVGDPDWTNIEFCRIWVDSVSTVNGNPNDYSNCIRFAEVNLVGNEWKLRKYTNASDTLSSDSLAAAEVLSIAVLNTHDNPDVYIAPKDVEPEIDPIQKIQGKEQSLAMKITNLAYGDSVSAQKEFYETQTLINYHRMKMYLYGKGVEGQNIEFFLQFGADLENYYEVTVPVYPEWDELNEIDLDFQLLSEMKYQMGEAEATFVSDTLDNGQIVKICGKPSLTNVRQLTIGVRNKNKDKISPFTGEIWLDELRLSGVRKDKGIAMRLKTDIQLSDFISFNGEFNQKDADFHTINERFGEGSTSISGSMNASIQLHKLLPTSWGLSLPVSTTYQESKSTPKYLPGSDVNVEEANLTDEQLEEIQSISKSQGVSASLSKRTKSRNFFIRYIIDPIRLSGSARETHSSSSSILFSDNTSYSGSFTYSLNFGNQHYLQPFSWLGKNGFLKSVAESKFFYMPNSVTLKMDGSDTQKQSETRSGVPTDVYTATMTRSFSTAFKPITPLSVDYSQTRTMDMRNDKWADVVNTLDPGELTSFSQQFGSSLNPKIFNWLTHNFKYSANYQYSNNLQLKEKGTGQSASVTTSVSFNGNFDPSKFVKSFERKKSSRSKDVKRPRSRNSNQNDSKSNNEEKEEKGPNPLTKVFPFLGKALDKIDPVSVSLTDGNTASNYGILAQPDLDYQLGFTTDPAVPVSEYVTTDRSSLKNNYRLALGSGLKITRELTVKLDYSFTTSESRSTTNTGTESQTIFLKNGKAMPFPTWTIQYRGFQKLPFVKKYVKNASFSHSFSGKKTQNWSDTKDNLTKETINKDYRPLVGLNLTFNNNMTTNFQYTSTYSLSEQFNSSSTGQQSEQTSNAISLTMKYSKKGGMRIPLFGKKKLDNNIDFSLTFSSSDNQTKQNKGRGTEFSTTSKTSNWSLKPVVSYTFTKTVRGGLNFEFGQRDDYKVGKTTIKAFGLNANISLSGG